MYDVVILEEFPLNFKQNMYPFSALSGALTSGTSLLLVKQEIMYLLWLDNKEYLHE